MCAHMFAYCSYICGCLCAAHMVCCVATMYVAAPVCQYRKLLNVLLRWKQSELKDQQ